MRAQCQRIDVDVREAAAGRLPGPRLTSTTGLVSVAIGDVSSLAMPRLLLAQIVGPGAVSALPSLTIDPVEQFPPTVPFFVHPQTNSKH